MTFFFGFAAFAYSLAGHAGASAYTPLALAAGLPALEARSVALLLNLAVSALALGAFASAGKLRLRLMAPLLAGSLPFCFWGSRLLVHSGALNLGMGVALLAAASRFYLASKAEESPLQAPSTPGLIASGALLGLLSGLTGIGGGIYLSSVMLFKRWATASETAAAAACFIFANSLASLMATGVHASPRPEWLAACLLGGLAGSLMGSRLLSPKALWRAQAAILLLAAFKILVP